MSLSIYLYFEGTCEQAFDHYLSVFDAKEICRQKYGDAPNSMFGSTPPDHIMHTTIQINDAILMGSDRPHDCDGPFIQSNSFAISYRPKSKMEADELFAKLSAGGNINMPLQQTFWGSYYGLCTDRFGVCWMFNLPQEEQESVSQS